MVINKKSIDHRFPAMVNHYHQRNHQTSVQTPMSLLQQDVLDTSDVPCDKAHR